ncbi:hypothetical protein HR45_00255 [Shewanella mangrovi]|uniref:DUF3530 domain-containing protein n=2 Tax=Shewanella mangrovi TaxID=1515746 RepID=A0A094JG36_9GAMM|nr:hypothetical protein HR45_00255 [Shewanella mangrovi]
MLALPAMAQSSAVGDPQRNTIEVQGQQTTVLVQPWEGRKQHGSVLLLPSLGQTADAPGLITYLRTELPLSGWATFSVSAPQRPTKLNFTTKAEDVSKAGDGKIADTGAKPTQHRSADEWQQLRQQQQRYLAELIEQVSPMMQQYPGGWVLISENQTAALVMEMIANQQLSMPNLLVVINPYSADSQQNRQLADQYGLFAMPVLDIQSPDGSPQSLATVAQRQLKIAALVAKQSRQQQLSLNLSQPTAYAECLNIIKGMSLTTVH